MIKKSKAVIRDQTKVVCDVCGGNISSLLNGSQSQATVRVSQGYRNQGQDFDDDNSVESERLSEHENPSPSLSLFDLVNDKLVSRISKDIRVQHFVAYNRLYFLQRFFHKRFTRKVKAARLISYKIRQFLKNREHK